MERAGVHRHLRWRAAPVQVSPGAEAGAHDCGFGWERAVSMPVIDRDARVLLYLRTYRLTGGARPLMIRCRVSAPKGVPTENEHRGRTAVLAGGVRHGGGVARAVGRWGDRGGDGCRAAGLVVGTQDGWMG